MLENDFATVGELTAALSARTVSALELLDLAIERIEKIDLQINAVVVRDFDRARDAAGAADAARAAGASGPLLGVPMTVKEAVNVTGLPTTWGLPQFREWLPDTDAIAVSRLKRAGAIVLGKTNVPPFLADWQCANAVYGRTANPWNPACTPGGSSGGSAAALASGLVPLELGTDLSGSIRVPAAFCGVFGLKPSYGLIPMRGVAPPGVDGVPPPLAVLGPMGRCAADLALALDVLAGPADDEGKAYRLALPPARHERLADFRVLLLDRLPPVPLDDELRATLHAVADLLEARGAKVQRPSGFPVDLAGSLGCFQTMIEVTVSRGAPEGGAVAAHAWLDALDRQLEARRQWARLFESVDAVLAPVFGTTAFEDLVDQDMNDRRLLVNGVPTPYAVQGAWSVMASLANLPAVAVPVGVSAAGLPIGAQIIGPYLEDRTVLALAEHLERELGGFRPPTAV